ncbi:MAG TPA: hypothetical protein VJ723_06650, partial [Candidatus Angelobacter sp.]|nr:hypothetical protein [Candidatus Angelobacter sp.]
WMIVLPAHQNDVQLRAVQWMHEFGHRKGLCHRTCPDGALMVPAPSIGNINIDPCESNILEGVTPNPACNACDIQTCDIPQQGGRISIADFVRQEFVEGIPYVPDIEYTAADIQYLDTLLNRPAEQAHWANAVVVLGMTGDRKAFELLKNFLERDIGPISPDADSAKLAVPIALGYLLAKTGNKEVFDYLRTGLDPTAWSDKVHWRASKGQRDDARDAHLTRLTILGLGLSGRREALRSLQSLLHQLSVRDAFPRKFKEGTGKYLREAIQINQHVRDVGLAQYYRDSETALFAARR